MREIKGDLLRVSVERDGEGPLVVSLAGELDLSTIPMLEGRLLGQVRSRRSVIVDLTRVSFIDSSGIAMLIEAFRTANGGAMHTVIAEGSQVERVFTIAGINRALPVFGSRAEAAAALNDGNFD